MSIIKLSGLIIITMIAVLIDCYAGYTLFLMTAMPIGYYLSPFLLLFIIISVPTIFIVSIINLFKFRKWAYYAFLVVTLLMHLFLIEEDVYYFFIKAKIKDSIGIEQFIPVASLTFFLIFFLLPVVRRRFK